MRCTRRRRAPAARTTSAATAGSSRSPRASAATPVELTGEDADGEPLDLADLPRQVVVVNVWWSWCGPCRTEMPLLVDAADELGRRHVRRHQHPRPEPGDGAGLRARLGVAYPSIFDPGQRGAARLPGAAQPARRCPSTVVLDPAGPGRRADPRRDPVQADPARPRRGRRRRSRAMGDWFQDTALSGSLLLAIPVALVAGLVSFFSPCVIPLLPGYLSYATGLSGADLADSEADAAPRPDARRLGALRARLLGRLRRPRACSRRGVSRLVLRVTRAPSRRPRRARRSCSAWSSWGWCRCFQRDVRVHKVPGGRAGRRAAARLPLRPRLDALHRPDPRRDPRPWPSTSATAARGGVLLGFYSLGLGRAVHPRRRWPGARALGAVRVRPPPPGVGDPARRR